jgi:hypothetical protein
MHLTYRSPLALGAAPEIEITPEMLTAGELALSEFSSAFESLKDAAERIYQAMEAARLNRAKNYVIGV